MGYLGITLIQVVPPGRPAELGPPLTLSGKFWEERDLQRNSSSSLRW